MEPVLTALDIVKNIVGNVLVSRAIEKTAEEVGKGQGLGQALSAHDIFHQIGRIFNVHLPTLEIHPLMSVRRAQSLHHQPLKFLVLSINLPHEYLPQ